MAVRKTVYLAGLISTEKPASLQWRGDAGFALLRFGFRVLSPMRGKKNLKSESVDGGITTTMNTSRDIILRDYHDILESDVVLAHLDDFGSNRPLVGTIFELAWAWQLKKPVVAIASADNYLMRKHPFVSEVVSHYFESVAEAVKFIAAYYGEEAA